MKDENVPALPSAATANDHCTCFEVYGEDPRCALHGVATDWAIENTSPYEWQNMVLEYMAMQDADALLAQREEGRVMDWMEQLAALAEKATPADILECDGAYPGLVELRGLSFKVSFWTLATDITFEQAQQRRADADLLRALWNHRAAILALGRERDALQSQIDQLANYIMNEVEGEPSQSQGAVETAIRIMRQALEGGNQ